MSATVANKQVYRVILDGYLLPGNDEEEVVARLSRLFGSNDEKIRTMLDGEPTVIKRRLTKNKAYQYLRTINNAGAACHIDKLLATDPEETAQLPVHVERTTDSLKSDILGSIKKRIQERNDFSEVMRQEIMEIDEARRRSNVIIITLISVLSAGIAAAVLYLVLS